MLPRALVPCSGPMADKREEQAAVVPRAVEMRTAARRRAELAFDQAVTEANVVTYHIAEIGQLAGRLRLRRRARAWWRTWSWLFLAAVVLACYGLAVAYDTPNHSLGARLVDSLKIFPSGFPGYDESRPWQYNLARYLASAVFILGSLRLLTALLSEHIDEVRARLRSGHAVVCGLGETGSRSVRSFRAARYRVTCIETDTASDAVEEARALRALVLHKDATQVSALEAARVDRAEYVVCAGADDATNTKVASLVAAIAHASGSRRGPSVHVHVDDPDLAQLLRGPLASVGAARFHFFNSSGVWARAALDDAAGPFARLDGKPPRIAVFGATALGRAVVVGAASRWHEHVRRGGGAGRAAITLVAPSAGEACLALTERYPAIPRVCDLVPLERAPLGALSAGLEVGVGAVGEPSALYACLDDPSANLALALEAERRLDGDAPTFLPATAAAAALGPLLLGNGRVRPVVLPRAAAALELLHDHMRESLAREAHAAYIDERRRQHDFGARPADRPWDELDHAYRDASRRHVDAMVDQLRATWFELEPRLDWDEPVAELPLVAVEAMAELEHDRWCRDRRRDGWRYAPVRDDAAKEHDLLVGWRELPEEARELDRAMVRRRAAILARAGFRLARDPARERLARALHERYAAARTAEGAATPYAVAWEELPEEARERNRAAVDHLAVELARVGCRACPAALGPAHAAVLTPDEIETMAELEHKRWVDERLASGWALGPRDDAACTHPSLVPWPELPDGEREKDREVVRAVPALLASAGRTVVRDGA